MDIRELKAFIAVATELNFRKAAERLNMSQPPLTRLISNLEEYLRVKLFNRNTKKVELTAAGDMLLRRAPKLVTDMEKLERDVRKSNGRATESLRIGISSTGFQSWVPESLERFKSKHKKTKVEVRSDITDRLLRDLRIGRLDIACVELSDSVPSGFDSMRVAEDPIGVLMLKSHRLAKKKAVRISDLSGETFIVHSRHEHAHIYEAQRLAFRDAGIACHYYTKKKNETCSLLVASGKGLSLTGRSQSHPAPPNTVFVPLVDSELKTRLELVWNKPCSEEVLCGLVAQLKRDIPKKSDSPNRKIEKGS